MSEGTQQVEWNFAGLQNMELARLGTEANNAFMQGRYSKAVKAQMARKQVAVYTFSPTERKKLEAIEKKFDTLLVSYEMKVSFNPKEVAKSRTAELQLRLLYSEYVCELQDLLDKYGFFGGRKKDASKMNIR